MIEVFQRFWAKRNLVSELSAVSAVSAWWGELLAVGSTTGDRRSSRREIQLVRNSLPPIILATFLNRVCAVNADIYAHLV